MKREIMFTSESVTEGHPDKLCDQISDAIVDHFILQDPYARVRAECAVSSAIVFIAGRFFTSAKVDLPHVARKVIKRIGYDQTEFNSKSCSIITAPQGFPPDENYVFDEKALSDEEIDNFPARNQVTVFGFACQQSPTLMPLPIWLAHRLTKQLTLVRTAGVLPYLAPDGKVQVGVVYKERTPYRIHSITVSASQKNARKPSRKVLQSDIIEHVIKPVFEDEEIKLDKRSLLLVNPDGIIVTGGPSYHSGLTGRKSAVDTYGEYSRHSGDALSGKDPLRIDRIGAYAARHAAKNVVAAGLASECEVMISYSIGQCRPVSLNVQTNGTGRIPDMALTDLVDRLFDFRPLAILRRFALRDLPRRHNGSFYRRIATYGHVGRSDIDLPWEALDKKEELESIRID
jgi:S-adenosylmethionine synthetase